MRIERTLRLLGLMTLAVLCLSQFATAEGGGDVRLGYVYNDDEGNRAVNQESYNVYEGMSFSLEEWYMVFDNGVNLSADMTDITLNNRNLRARASKAGLFDLSFTNNQYRRVYSFEGDRFTRRRTTGARVSVQPHRYVTFFGGMTRSDRHGDIQEVLSPVVDTLMSSTDYSHTTYDAGTRLAHRYGVMRLEYRRFDFADNITPEGDREADQFTLNLSSTVPGWDWLQLAAGYRYRTDKMSSSDLDLTTNQYWGGAKFYLPCRMTADYRLLLAGTERDMDNITTDHVSHTFSLGKNWTRYGGLRLGYELRTADDDVNRTESGGFLFSGWYNWQSRLFLKASGSTRETEVKEGVVLVGDEDYTRHRVSAQYRAENLGDMTVRWLSRLRKNEDIGSQVDYDMIASTLNLRHDDYGRFSVTYAYYLGKFENRSDETSYEFSDNTLSGSIHPPAYRNVSVSFGGTYYRSRRDQDLEKSSLNFGVMYDVTKDWQVQAHYNVFNFDDFLARGAYYTANIVEISLKRSFSIK